jgi:uncharacterized protein (DUF1800 family)
MRQFTKYWKFSVIIWLVVILPSSAANSPDSKILHILNRLSFGPKPGDVERVRKMGVDRYIEEQLSPQSISESSELKAQLESLDTLNLNPLVLVEQYSRFSRKPGVKPTPEEIKATSAKRRLVLDQSIKARLLRATLSDRQLEEVMVDFWFNHFNVYANKGLDRVWVGSYERQAIRPHVFGKFRDLLGATAHHPAMLFYLDNWRSTASRNSTARGRSQGLNENYARELMELHTLGVGSGYTQEDVVALAKILTGWGFPPKNTVDNASPQGFYFNSKRHDFSDKTFLGHQIKGTGESEGEKALDILASHPATARRISERLAQYFVADKPPEALVKRLTKRYIDTDGNIREMLKTLFDSPEFQDPKVYQAKFKTPYRYVLSAIRATGVEVRNVQPINAALRQLGMPLYGSLAPDGYKNTEDAWLNPDAINRRISFATALANGRLPLSATQPKSLPPKQRNAALGTPVNPQQLTQTLGNGFSSKTQKAIANKPPNLQSALLLGSPEFMRH